MSRTFKLHNSQLTPSPVLKLNSEFAHKIKKTKVPMPFVFKLNYSKIEFFIRKIFFCQWSILFAFRWGFIRVADAAPCLRQIACGRKMAIGKARPIGGLFWTNSGSRRRSAEYRLQALKLFDAQTVLREKRLTLKPLIGLISNFS